MLMSSMLEKILADKTIKKRFWKYVTKGEEPDQCWIWHGADNKGYGKIKIGKKTVLAHRVSYALHFGKLLNDKMVCHTCDNTKCVNPRHLWLGNNRENQIDSFSKGRSWIIRLSENQSGNKNINARIDILRARFLIAAGFRNFQIAKKLDVNRQTIADIKSGKTWSGKS